MTSKVVIVTGASSGIGLAVAQHLIKHSHKVVLVARRREELERLRDAHPDQVDCVVGDLTDYSLAPSITDLAIRRFGQIDGLVINHGTLGPTTRLEDAAVEEWVQCYETNVFSAVALIKHAIPELRRREGCVVFTSSGAATKSYTAWGAYGSSKAALHSIATHLAVEEPAICSVSISPGRVDTDMQKAVRDSGKAAMQPAEYATFADAYRDGTLSPPQVPAAVIARVVVKPAPELSGRFLRLDAPELCQHRGPQE